MRSKNPDLHIERFDMSEGIFSWDAFKFFLETGEKSILLIGIVACPYCEINLEKEYQKTVNPSKQEQATDTLGLCWGC